MGPYVESALRPVQGLREVAERAVMPQDQVDHWIRKAIDGCAIEFASNATQLLESTRQQEASLRRLGRGGAGADAQVSDLDKIHVQLCLDVDIFTKAAAELGATTANVNGLVTLSAAVESVWPRFRSDQPE